MDVRCPYCKNGPIREEITHHAYGWVTDIEEGVPFVDDESRWTEMEDESYECAACHMLWDSWADVLAAIREME